MRKIYLANFGTSFFGLTNLFTAFKPTFQKDSSAKSKNGLSRLAFPFLILFAFALSQKTIAQTANLYTFSTVGTGSLAADIIGNVIDMTTGTTQLVGASQDDASSATAPAKGFNFTFMSTVYTQFSASSNGGIRLGATIMTNNIYGNTFPFAAAPIIAPYLQDLGTSSTGKVHYKLIGAYPNRTLVIEFLNMKINYNSSTVDGTFQARLYEQTNIIEFVYGGMKVNGLTSANSRIAAIGFSNTTGVNNEFSVNQSTYATTTSAAPITNTNSATGNIAGLNSAANGSRRVFTFKPTVAYKSQFISMSTGSAAWCVGEQRNVTVTVKNIGTASWTNAGSGMNIGLKWDEDVDYGGAPTNIPRISVQAGIPAGAVAPGATVTYTFPSVPGSQIVGINHLTFDVVREGDCWFGGNGGTCGPGNSAYTSPAITITNPVTPTATTPQIFCASANPTVTNLTTLTGI
ncbi:MAG: hypothetical protein ABI707_16955, partial [Ferruginibacter sp.]